MKGTIDTIAVLKLIKLPVCQQLGVQVMKTWPRVLIHSNYKFCLKIPWTVWRYKNSPVLILKCKTSNAGSLNAKTINRLAYPVFIEKHVPRRISKSADLLADIFNMFNDSQNSGPKF